MSSVLNVILSACLLTPFISRSTALEGVFADVVMYSDNSCTTLLSAQQIYGPPIVATDNVPYMQTPEPAFASFRVISLSNVGDLAACEKGCDCDANDCMDLHVQPSEFGYDQCIAVEGVEFEEFCLSAGEIDLNVCVNTPCGI